MVCLFNLAILVGVKWHLIAILICIFLMTNDVGHIFVCVLIGHLYIFGEISVQILCPFLGGVQFLIGLFVFLLLSGQSFKNILDTKLDI